MKKLLPLLMSALIAAAIICAIDHSRLHADEDPPPDPGPLQQEVPESGFLETDQLAWRTGVCPSWICRQVAHSPCLMQPEPSASRLTARSTTTESCAPSWKKEGFISGPRPTPKCCFTSMRTDRKSVV